MCADSIATGASRRIPLSLTAPVWPQAPLVNNEHYWLECDFENSTKPESEWTRGTIRKHPVIHALHQVIRRNIRIQHTDSESEDLAVALPVGPYDDDEDEGKRKGKGKEGSKRKGDSKGGNHKKGDGKGKMKGGIAKGKGKGKDTGKKGGGKEKQGIAKDKGKKGDGKGERATKKARARTGMTRARLHRRQEKNCRRKWVP